MPPTTDLQSQFPLSPRKFWKKILPAGVISLCVTPVISITIVAFGSLIVKMGGYFIALFWGVSAVVFVMLIRILSRNYKAYIKSYYYSANADSITIKKEGREVRVPYAQIQAIYVDQDIDDRIYGLYDVHLAGATAPSTIEAHIDGVDKGAADGLKDFLLRTLKNGGAASTTPVAPSSSVPFTSEISSRTYPVVSSWISEQMVSWIFLSIFFSIVTGAAIFTGAFKHDERNGTLPTLGQVATLDWNMILTRIGLIVLVMSVAIYIWHLVYSRLWRSTFSFSFLPDYIVMKEGIIEKSESYFPYRAVQDVSVSQGIIERLFGLATVCIETAAVEGVGKQAVTSVMFIPGQPLEKANEIRDVVKRVTLTKSTPQTGV